MRGFSLVELIVTLALLSILAIGSSRFLLDATDGYAATNERIRLSDIGNTVLELASRELSTALPLSVRVSTDGKCIEWIRVRSGGRYQTAPVGYSSNSVDTLGLDVVVGQRLSIPSSDPYALVAPNAVSPPVLSVNATATDALRMTLSASHEFSTPSLANRIYAVDVPESFCFANNRLWHYRDYGYLSAQPGPLDLPSALPQRTPLATDIDVLISGFRLSEPTLTRNGLVSMTLHIRNDQADIALERHINVRNVP